MSFESEALLFVEHLQTLYFEQRDLKALLFAMDEETSWIGTGEQELCENLEDAQNALLLEAEEYSGSFTIISSNYKVSSLSENVCVVYGLVSARPGDSELADIHNRITAICILTPKGMKLAHLHMSAPDADQEEGRFYVKSDESGQRETLRKRAEKVAKELRKRNRELEALTTHIPGGVHQYECDKDMTFIGMSSSFIALTGYSQQEIEQRFHNKFAEMVYFDDLARIQAEMKEQLSFGDKLELEYRILRRDGELMWILEQGKRATLEDGSQCFYSMLMNNTKQKNEHEKLRLSLERHQIIMDQTTDIIFEWDIDADTLTCSNNWRKKFGYEAVQTNISAEIPKSNKIHPNDMLAFIKIMQDSKLGVPYSETEFRIQNVLGEFTWNRIRATVQYDFHKRPIKAVGVISDIDEDKKQRQLLLDQAQHDPLTNLYNKAAVRELVESKMNSCSGEDNQALLIIDVDNFKSVNDTYGHLCGDSLLSDVAITLKSHFRSDDIVGRIGGDEFLVYLPEITEKSVAEDKIEGVLNALRILRPVKYAAPISCSIGVAFFPQKSTNYFELYQCADMALYQVKATGRDNYTFYDSEICDGHISMDILKTAVGAIDSDLEKTDVVGEKLAHYTFQMLYSSIDVTTAVKQLLEILGRSYNVSRVYIFESTEDGKRCNNTFEWCNTNVSPEIHKLQNIDYKDDLGDYTQNFNEDHVFYCQDVRKLHPDVYALLKPQGIRSLLQCAIIDDETFKGYVGFDECRENRTWTKEQVRSLTLIANVLSTFLIKVRLKEQLKKSKETNS